MIKKEISICWDCSDGPCAKESDEILCDNPGEFHTYVLKEEEEEK